MKNNILKCHVCSKEFKSGKALNSHIVSAHAMGIKYYYDKYIKKSWEGYCKNCEKPTNFVRISFGYREFCCLKCSFAYRKKTAKPMSMECKECNLTIKGQNDMTFLQRFRIHLRTVHNLSLQEYYDKHLLKKGEKECLWCGKDNVFYTFFKGYSKYCSNDCVVAMNKHKNTVVQKNFKEEQSTITNIEENKKKIYELEHKSRLKDFEYENEKASWCLVEFDRTKTDLNFQSDEFNDSFITESGGTFDSENMWLN